MPNIEYKIIIDSEGALVGIKDLNSGQQVLFDNMKKNTAETKVFVDNLNKSITEQQKRVDELWKSYEKGEMTYKEYANAVDDANKNMLDLNDAAGAVQQTQTKVQSALGKTTRALGSMRSIMMKVNLILGLVAGAFAVFMKVLSTNQGTVDKIKVGIAGVKGAFDGLWKSLGRTKYIWDTWKAMKESAKAARELAVAQLRLVDVQNKTALMVSELTSLQKRYETAMNDESKSVNERIDAANEYYKAEWEILMLKQKLAKETYEVAVKQLMTETKLTREQVISLIELGETIDSNNKFYKEWTRMSREAKVTFTQAQIAYIEAGNELENFEKEKVKTIKDILKTYSEAVKRDQEERKREAERFAEDLLKVYEDYEQARLSLLTGEDRIKAERDFQLKQLENTKKDLQARGKLTEEQLNWFNIIERQIYNEADIALTEFHIEKLDKIRAQQEKEKQIAEEGARSLLDIQRETQQLAIDLLEDNSKAQLAFQIRMIDEQRAALSKQILSGDGTPQELKEAAALYEQLGILLNGFINKQAIEAEKFKFWKSLGIDDPEAIENIKASLQLIADTTVDVLDQIFAKRVEDAQRKRELVEEDIRMTEEALQTELQLMEMGYANNVTAKKKELEALKKEREKALKEEEKALKAQRALDTAMQITSLITASAQIFKATSKYGVAGVAIAIAAIAAMFGAFAVAKAQAAKATKLAKGGVGTVDGRSHAEGGEPFLKHVEVERGEMWGVLSKKATAKYGRAFEGIVTSFNKDKVPIASAVDNNIVVDIDQTNERLDKVEYQLVKLNRHFAGQKDVKDYGRYRIEKVGNKTRIIRKG